MMSEKYTDVNSVYNSDADTEAEKRRSFLPKLLQKVQPMGCASKVGVSLCFCYHPSSLLRWHGAVTVGHQSRNLFFRGVNLRTTSAGGYWGGFWR